jgi:hypothetical protein
VSDLALTGWSLVAAVAVLIAVWVVLGAASRLDRLHRRVAESRATLDAQLVRRATAALDLAVAGVLDPVSAVLVSSAAREALEHVPPAPVETAPGRASSASIARAHRGEVEEVDRAMAESDLSRVLRAALGDAEDRKALADGEGSAELLERLEREWYRVQLARRFYNDAVVQVRRIRAKGYVRLFRLAGHAPVPQTFEMDDATVEP